MRQHQFSFFSREEESFGSCDSCKKAHQKCDRARPACDRCSRMKLHCVYLPLKRISTSQKANSSKLAQPSAPSHSSLTPSPSHSQSRSSSNQSTPIPSAPASSPVFAFSTNPSFSPSSFAAPPEEKGKVPQNVSLLFASSMEGFSKSLATNMTATSPKKSGEDGKPYTVDSKLYVQNEPERPNSSFVTQMDKTTKRVLEIRRDRESDLREYNPKRIRKSPPVSEEDSDYREADRLIFLSHKSQPTSSFPSAPIPISPSNSLPQLPSISTFSRPVGLNSQSLATPLNSAYSVSPSSSNSPFASSPSSSSALLQRSPFSSHSPASSPFETAMSSPLPFNPLPSLFAPEGHEAEASEMEDGDRVEQFNRMLEEEEV